MATKETAQKSNIIEVNEPITLRDRFALAALPAMLTMYGTYNSNGTISEYVWELANAMVASREITKEPTPVYDPLWAENELSYMRDQICHANGQLDRLPMTADGKRIFGDTTEDLLVYGPVGELRVVYLNHEYGWGTVQAKPHTGAQDAPVDKCYSSREAALDAMKNRSKHGS